MEVHLDGGVLRRERAERAVPLRAARRAPRPVGLAGRALRLGHRLPVTARGPKVERSRSEHVLVTGGSGFIASHVVDLLLQRGDQRVTVLDKLTYAGNVENLSGP